MTEQKFQLNDRVSAFGCVGVVIDVYGTGLTVEFDCGPIKQRMIFSEEGRTHDWHKEPSLTLIERPKKMKKVWVNLYKAYPAHDVNGSCFVSKDAAEISRAATSGEFLACVEIEIEE